MIRRALPADAEAVREVVRAAYGRWTARLGRESSPMHDDYARVIADEHTWVLEDGGRLIGLLVLKAGPEALTVANIAVAPDQQGKGYGRQLLAFAEEETKRRGHREIRLYVNALMGENAAIYHHVGYKEIERFSRGGFDRVYLLMGKPIV